MNAELKENAGLPAHILWTLAIVAGISVANLYYNQPLLNLMRADLGVSDFQANLIAMITQIGYALGLLFIVPLGDLYRRKKIILVNFLLLVFALLTMALAESIYTIWAASLVTGVCSMIPQIFVPIASQYSRPENISLQSGQRLGWRTVGMARDVLYCRRTDVYLCFRRPEGTSRHTSYVRGAIQYFDEIPVSPSPGLSGPSHLFHTVGIGLRSVSGDVVMLGF